jgi:hypothetical protein
MYNIRVQKKSKKVNTSYFPNNQGYKTAKIISGNFRAV